MVEAEAAGNGQEGIRNSWDIPFGDTRRIISRARDFVEGDIRVQGTFLIDLGEKERENEKKGREKGREVEKKREKEIGKGKFHR